MQAKLVSQYLNEIVSLTVLSLMVIALITGQQRAEALAAENRESGDSALRLVIEDAMLGEGALVNGEITLRKAAPKPRPRGMGR